MTCKKLLGLKHLIFFSFLGVHLWHMEVPRLGVKSELQLPAYAIATATQDPSRVCNLYHSSCNAGSLTHWARSVIKPEMSWFVVGFISAVPQWEFPLWELFGFFFFVFTIFIKEFLPITYFNILLCFYFHISWWNKDGTEETNKDVLSL